MRITRLAPVAVFAAAALFLTGCVNNVAETPGSSSSASAVTKDDALAKLVPEKIATAGKLVIGTDATYKPNEYKDPNGNVIGWEVDLADAIAAKLGLKTEYQVAKFDNILPSIIGGKYDLGLSSFFDTVERQKQVDMVDYYTAGIQWATLKGKTVDPDNACGLKLAVQNGTTEALDDGPAKSKACTDAGKAAIEFFGYDTQDEATSALTLGRVDAMSADSPVTQFAVQEHADTLILAGDVYSTFFYGMPIAKDNGTLAQAIKGALDALKADGTYTEILTKWAVEKGALDTFGINLAKD